MTAEHIHPQGNLQSRLAEPAEGPGDWSREAVLSEILHRVGHDIGNPLTAIISLSSILEFSSAPAERPEDAKPFPRDKLNEYSSSIMAEAWKVSHIIDRVVMMFSDRKGNVGPCVVGEIAERALQRLRSRMHLQDLKIDSDYFFAPTAARVLADMDQLFLVISELLLNAYVFQAPFEGAPRTVYCALEQEGSLVHLKFRNPSAFRYGDELADLFRPLKCAADKTVAKGTRTGLGLAAVWAIVARHGGKIAIEESETPSGPVFTVHVHLPAADESAERGGNGS